MNNDSNQSIVKCAYKSSEEFAKHLRIKALDMAYKAKSSHMGGLLSEADIIAVLYHDILKYNSADPTDDSRDRFILSKGHCCAVLYSALADCGFFPVNELDHFGENGSIFPCHVSHKVPGVELSSGSLGHGCAVAAGIALNGKIRNKYYHVYTLMGDGECNEGSVWEMIMFAGHHKLDNLTIIIDANKMQAMGNTKDIIELEPFSEKLRDFKWMSLDVDGHNHDELKKAFKESNDGMPKAIIAHTIKGKGISFMENELWWHYQVPYGDYYLNGKKELEGVAL